MLYSVLIFCFLLRTVEDFRDWTNWLLYRGGIGVKGEESWEAWWDEELVFVSSSHYSSSILICLDPPVNVFSPNFL